MNPKSIEELSRNFETEMENMELRILESIWSLERAVLDQMESLKSLRNDIRGIKSQFDLQFLQSLDRSQSLRQNKTNLR